MTKGSKQAGTRPSGKSDRGGGSSGQRSRPKNPASKARSSLLGSGSTRAMTITGILVVVGFAVVVALTTWGGSSGDAPAPSAGGSAELGAPAPAATLIRPDSHRLSPPAGDRVRFVEFLDLECEACGAAYPTVERLRSEYAGRVDFVARYFPLPSHQNAEPAAFATEAAARQGQFEAMYKAMYDTQPQWGDQQVDHAPTFRGYAQQIGLDMARYDRDLADPTLRSRVLADRNDGVTVGVQGTPTIFINDRRVEGDRSYEALKTAIDQALAAP